MAFFPTTALHIMGAVDCAVLSRQGADAALLAEFLDIVQPQAENALLMGEALGLLEREEPGRPFHARGLLPQILVSCNQARRPCVFRLALEQYEPFALFAHRLAQSHTAQEAARAVRAVVGLAAHREEIASTLTDLGTFSNALEVRAGGLLLPRGREVEDYLSATADVLDDRQSALLFVTRRLGTTASQWVDRVNVLDHLVTAYQRSSLARDDSRAPIMHAGNALESFLEQFATHHAISLAGATGINAKADRLYQANPRRITTKHLNLLKYLGHVRNAADHGIDSETGQTWTITEGTSHEYVHVAMTAISSVVAFLSGTHRI
jgi:hypothetical protein